MIRHPAALQRAREEARRAAAEAEQAKADAKAAQESGETTRGGSSLMLTKQTATYCTSAGVAEVGLGLINAVRAAFKAGVTPSRIARQFGISQTDVRRALTAEGTKT
jgi:hypothetical protein